MLEWTNFREVSDMSVRVCCPPPIPCRATTRIVVEAGASVSIVGEERA